MLIILYNTEGDLNIFQTSIISIAFIQGVFVTLHFGALISFYPFKVENSNLAWVCYNSSSFGPANHIIWTCQYCATIWSSVKCWNFIKWLNEVAYLQFLQYEFPCIIPQLCTYKVSNYTFWSILALHCVTIYIFSLQHNHRISEDSWFCYFYIG